MEIFEFTTKLGRTFTETAESSVSAIDLATRRIRGTHDKLLAVRVVRTSTGSALVADRHEEMNVAGQARYTFGS